MKFLKIRNIFFKGDRGGEDKLHREVIMALINQNKAIIDSMTDTQKTRYTTSLGETDLTSIEKFNEFNTFVENLNNN